MGPLGKPLGQHLLEQPDLARHPPLLGMKDMKRVQTAVPAVEHGHQLPRRQQGCLLYTSDAADEHIVV